jgi:hypothetical protein
MSNVRPFMRKALVIARSGRVAVPRNTSSPLSSRAVRPPAASARPAVCESGCAAVARFTERLCHEAPLTRRRRRWRASVGALSLASVSRGLGVWAAPARMRVAGHPWRAVAGARGERNACFAAGRVHAQVVPLFTRPNHSIERTAQSKLWSAAHVER